MADAPPPPSPLLVPLQKALDDWAARGRAVALKRWLIRELDADGAPVKLPLEAWTGALDGLAAARQARAGERWPRELDDRIAGFIRARLRFSRPDGGLATFTEPPSEPRKFWSRVHRAFPLPEVARVLSWWFPNREAEFVPPPLPAWCSAQLPLGVLRADWSTRGDLLAFDHRAPRTPTRIELYGAGVRWLGPSWGCPTKGDGAGAGDANRPPALSAWGSNSTADVAEWTFASGRARTTRMLMMLRGRRLALLGDQIDGTTSGEVWRTRLALPDEVLVDEPSPFGDWTLRTSRQGKSAQVIPIGEPPASAVDNARLSFHPESRELSLFRVAPGERTWMPWLVSWDHARRRKPLTWATLTVAEQGEPCPPHVAWAARVTWRRGETYVVYRSLGPPARRSFLGHSTTERFVLAEFTADGEVYPLVTLA